MQLLPLRIKESVEHAMHLLPLAHLKHFIRSKLETPLIYQYSNYWIALKPLETEDVKEATWSKHINITLVILLKVCRLILMKEPLKSAGVINRKVYSTLLHTNYSNQIVLKL